MPILAVCCLAVRILQPLSGILCLPWVVALSVFFCHFFFLTRVFLLLDSVFSLKNGSFFLYIKIHFMNCLFLIPWGTHKEKFFKKYICTKK